MEQNYVFLDTNIYIGSRYSFTNKYFTKLKELTSAGSIKLLSCSSVVGEVKEHIKDDLDKAVKEFNKAVKVPAFASVLNDERYSEKLGKLDAEVLIDHVCGMFQSYLTDCETTFFGLDGICVEKLMKDYFEQNAPFETKKPNEFKDAIMIEALKKYQASLGEKILIVSTDGGFRKAFQNNTNFRIFDKLGELLNYQEITNGAFVAARKYFNYDDNFDEIQAYIEEYLLNASYYYDEMIDWNYDSLNIEEIEYELNYIDSDDKDNVIVYLEVSSVINMSSKFLDTENSYYDKEDDEYLIKSYITSNERHTISQEVELKLKYYELEEECNSFKIELDKTEIDLNRFNVELSENTLIERTDEESFMSDNDKKWYDNNVVNCSECGKRLGFNDSGNFHDYFGEPLCYDCAVTNDKGFICPSCGLKIPYKYMGNSGTYCVDCEAECDY